MKNSEKNVREKVKGKQFLQNVESNAKSLLHLHMKLKGCFCLAILWFFLLFLAL